MAEAEHPERTAPGHQVTVEDVRRLMGASTPHFALQLRNRIRKLIRDLPPDDPARLEGDREIARLERLGFTGEVRGEHRQLDLLRGCEPRPIGEEDSGAHGPDPSPAPGRLRPLASFAMCPDTFARSS